MPSAPGSGQRARRGRRWAGFAAVLALRIEATASGIRRLADAGEPVFGRLVTDGTVDAIERSRRWIPAHAEMIDTALL